jgi:hypothetical protein
MQMQGSPTIRRPTFGTAILSAVAIVLSLTVVSTFPRDSAADVPKGDAAKAEEYFRALSNKLEFSTPEKIFQTTLDDVASYFGYEGMTGIDLQDLPPAVLMSPDKLLAPCNQSKADPCAGSLRNRATFAASPAGKAARPGDILAIRFFAPKIMNIRLPEENRPVGWRKLVRLKAQPGSVAEAHRLSEAIILFNIFTAPGAPPFASGDESINTQVMLITDLASVAKPNEDGLATLYWLDYGKLSKGGQLSLSLSASFDANELPESSLGTQPYFVPDGCAACHGNSQTRSMVNYLDTDHWYDRLENDFTPLKAHDVPLLVDAGTNDTKTAAYRGAFAVIRQFNSDADAQAHHAQPTHDEALASRRWLELHATSVEYSSPIDRAIGAAPQWSGQVQGDAQELTLLDQYCFRCHGTIKFSVFDKRAVQDRRASIRESIRADAPLGIRMPPDRELTDAVRQFLHDHLP